MVFILKDTLRINTIKIQYTVNQIVIVKFNFVIFSNVKLFLG